VNFVSREVEGNIETGGNQNLLLPSGPVKPGQTGGKQMTCNSGQHFAGNSELFPV